MAEPNIRRGSVKHTGKDGFGPRGGTRRIGGLFLRAVGSPVRAGTDQTHGSRAFGLRCPVSWVCAIAGSIAAGAVRPRSDCGRRLV